jgi:catechol 2,3-dioxygenase-like lactoylglutathione lyase family enzyme
VLDHIAINVANIEKSICWYSDLGFATLYEDTTWALLQRGSIKLALTLPNQHPPHIAIRVVDTDHFPNGKISTHRDGSKYLYQKDPDGNVVEWIYYP